MNLWVLGPIYLFYINCHGKGYLRMTPLFKAKMVATASGRLEPDNGCGEGQGAGWNLTETPKWTLFHCLLPWSTQDGDKEGACYSNRAILQRLQR